MADSTVSVGGGCFSMIWLVSAVSLWIRPTSFPLWLLDLMNIIFWIGIIGVAAILALFLILVVFSI